MLNTYADRKMIIEPAQLGAENPPHANGTLPVLAPQFVGFQCFACGQRHAEIVALAQCHEQLRNFYALQKANAL